MNTANINPPVQLLLDQVQHILADHYGDRLSDILLYGSYARNEQSVESDIDLLVVLEGTFDRARELRSIIDILYPLQLRTEFYISAKPISTSEIDDRGNPFVNTLLEESVAV